MSLIYLYKHCIPDEEKISLLRSHFYEHEIIAFEHFNDIESCSVKEKHLCLIELNQVRELKKDDFMSFISKIGQCCYIILLYAEDTEKVRRLMKTGGKSFLLMDDSVDLIIECIEKTIQYGGYISPRIVSLLNIENNQRINAQIRFTPKLRTVLFELLKGKSDKMIADALKISYLTAKVHRKKIYKILNVNSQGELFALMH